jgi:N-terminal acetyltransferase B complex non-catalytic subunit
MARYPTYDEYRDKPKKGISRCDELLKRTPKDMQLLATKSQLQTELGETAKAQATIDQLLAIQPSTRDLQEITLVEDAIVEHLQSTSFPQPLSAGPEVAKIWDHAFKTATQTNYKLDLQSLRFTRAIFDNRLQDAQQALIQLKLLMPKNRVFYMAHAAVTQLLSTGEGDLSSRLALMLAKKAVVEKFDGVKDLDCRVPGQIFAVQGKREELEEVRGGRFGESRQVFDALR